MPLPTLAAHESKLRAQGVYKVGEVPADCPYYKDIKLKKLFLLVLCVALFGCSNSYEAKKALSAMGFTEIQTDGYKWFACSDDDFYHTKFTAKNPNGQVVSGVVCTGFFFKNSTVRF